MGEEAIRSKSILKPMLDRLRTASSRTSRRRAKKPLIGSDKLRSEERRVGKERRSKRDWSSDVCSSDLPKLPGYPACFRRHGDYETRKVVPSLAAAWAKKRLDPKVS